MEIVSTSDIQGWMESIEQCLNEVCTIVSKGKLNSDQKIKKKLNRKVTNGVAQMAVHYQLLKQIALQAHSSLQHAAEAEDLMDSPTQIKQAIQESKIKQVTASASFADIVKKGSSNFVRFCSVIYPSDNSKTSEDTKSMVQKIISPEDMKLQVRGLCKIRNGSVVISTETKKDIEKLKQTVQLAESGPKVDEPYKRNLRIIVIGVPIKITENESNQIKSFICEYGYI